MKEQALPKTKSVTWKGNALMKYRVVTIGRMSCTNVIYKLQCKAMEIKQTSVFEKWEARLKDKRVRTIIAARVMRLSQGLPGDVEPVGGGVSELRIHYGPGYRVYFQQRGNTLVLLLCGGSKSTQSRDIDMAKKLAKEWSEQDD